MLDENTTVNQNDVVSEMPTRLDLIKKQATDMGLSFHPNSKEESILAKMKAHQEAKDKPKVEDTPTANVETKAVATPEDHIPQGVYMAAETEEAKAQRQRKEASVLKRVIVTCMNPNKKAMTGEYFSVSNRVIGTVKKFVQFDAPDGWHVPAIIVEHLKNSMCQVFIPSVTTTGKKTMKGKLVKQFNIVELPNLTAAELKELATQQALAGNID